MKFPWQKKMPPLAQRLHLVSLHIPKTAGTSFRHVLKEVYGNEEVLRVDSPIGSHRIKFNETPADTNLLPEGIQVIHGHFNLPELKEMLTIPDNVPTITWLRHPVERVISNYFYLKQRLEDECKAAGLTTNFLNKIQRNLIEFARDPINQNTQSMFLKDTPLRDFTFVGIQENMEEDVAALAKALCWNTDITLPRHNVTSGRRDISAEERAEIAKLNAEDMALYEEGLQLRENRIGEPKVDLISLHIPKTAGTSFYQSLRNIYGPDVSYSLRIKDHKNIIQQYGSLAAGLNANIKVLHGHVTYQQVANLHQRDQSKLICWMRDPVERVISHFLFFKSNLTGPIRNLELYHNNKHRVKEDLLTYARHPVCRNKLSSYLKGIALEDFFFIGFQETYAEDLQQLAKLLDWPEVQNLQLNVGKKSDREKLNISEEVRAEIARLNTEDIALFNQAKILYNK